MTGLCAAVLLGLPAFASSAAVADDPASASPQADAKAVTQTEPILFDKAVLKVTGGSFGSYADGLCWGHHPLNWYGDTRTSLDDEGLGKIFNQESAKYGYQVTGNPDALFEDESVSKARFRVAAMLTDLEMKVCYPKGAHGNHDLVKGRASLTVEWQVYATFDRKVIYTATTNGSFDAPDSISGGLKSLLRGAFATAADGILEDAAFRKLVAVQATPGPDSGATFTPLALAALPAYGQPFDKHSTEILAAVVTVETGDGHGSGFFISPDGYLLSDAHVVADADKVKVKLSSGIELVGTVVRKSPHRDVALIKVEGYGFKALPLQMTQAPLGAKVFAIGSPLEVDLADTVSSGIVSSYRDPTGLSMIQSDVSVHPGNSGGPLLDEHGNVIGLCESGIPSAAGLNFFNPIDASLAALNIVLQGAPK
jgi:serine protease Do